MQSSFRAGYWLIIVLVMSALACNLTRSSDEDNGASSSLGASNPPAVRLLNTPSTATVNTPLEVSFEASASSGNVTRVELLVNNFPVSQISGDGSNPFQQTLTWTPRLSGTVTASVVAYQGINASSPASFTVTVSNTATTGNTNTGGSNNTDNSNYTPNAPELGPCRAQMTTPLRLRSVPSTASDDTILLTFNVNDEAPILGRLSDNSWFQVQSTSGQIGWVFYNNSDGQYFSAIGECTENNVPILNAPVIETAPPTSTPAPSPTVPQTTPADVVALPISGPPNVSLDGSGSVTATYTLQVRNDGGSATAPFRVQVVLPDGQAIERDIPALNPGQVANAIEGGTYVLTFDEAGTYRISIFADLNGIINEPNEINNYRELSIVVSGS